jgi:hypothetical protein
MSRHLPHLMEPDLQAMYERAERNFEAKTTKKLRRSGAPKSLEDVTREMEARKVEDDSESVKIKNGAKVIGQRVLMRIQLLGGIAAQGAGMLSPTAPYYALIYSPGTLVSRSGGFSTLVPLVLDLVLMLGRRLQHSSNPTRTSLRSKVGIVVYSIYLLRLLHSG